MMKNNSNKLKIGKLKIAHLSKIQNLKGGTVVGQGGQSREILCGTKKTQCC